MTRARKWMKWSPVGLLGIAGCGYGLAYLFIGLYLYALGSSSNHESLAGHRYNATIQSESIERLALEIDRSVSTGNFIEERGFTAIGINDPSNKLTLEVVTPGMETGTFSVTRDQKAIAPFARVVFDGDEYTSRGIEADRLTVTIDAPYPAEVGEYYNGRVSGTLVNEDGTLQEVKFSFEIPRG